MDEIKKYIDTFIGTFEENLIAIKSVNFAVRDNLFKKVLYIGVIDASSKVVYPNKGHHKRFTGFTRNFCDWKNSERINLPHLIQLLKSVPEPEFSDLRNYSSSCMKSWRKGAEIKLDNDIEINEISKRWPKGYDKEIGKIKIEWLTHYNLLYNYRNSVIHEMRRPPDGIEHKDDKDPYYLSVPSRGEKEDHWELVYPLSFFHELCTTGLTHLKKYLEDNHLNPYEYFDFQEYWIPDLNL